MGLNYQYLEIVIIHELRIHPKKNVQYVLGRHFGFWTLLLSWAHPGLQKPASAAPAAFAAAFFAAPGRAKRQQQVAHIRIQLTKCCLNQQSKKWRLDPQNGGLNSTINSSESTIKHHQTLWFMRPRMRFDHQKQQFNQQKLRFNQYKCRLLRHQKMIWPAKLGLGFKTSNAYMVFIYLPENGG